VWCSSMIRCLSTSPKALGQERGRRERSFGPLIGSDSYRWSHFQYVDTGSRVRINEFTSYAFCVNAMLCGLLLSRDSFRNHQAVKRGVKIAVTMTDAAT
jgi:hypothetical protein